jgi:phenylalanyl-tRNA synthetase beta chain
MRRLVTQLASDLGFTIRFTSITDEMDFPVTAPFDVLRSALIESSDGTFVGMVGELKQSVIKNFKLPKYSSAMTLDFGGLLSASQLARKSYSPLSKYPSISQDISLKVAAAVPYADVFEAVSQAASSQLQNCDVKVTPVTIYQPEDDASTKTVTLRVEATSFERTLRDDDLKPVLDAAASTAEAQFHASRV